MIQFTHEINDKNVKFTAEENGVTIGDCLMKITEDFAEVFSLSYQQDKPYVVEGLLRSAFNYATLKNVYMGKVTCKNIDKFLDLMNFEKKNGEYVNDIPSILMGSCCKR